MRRAMALTTLRDLLLLADRRVPIHHIRRWSPRARKMAENWAVRAHLAASDNLLMVACEPVFLTKYPRTSP